MDDEVEEFEDAELHQMQIDAKRARWPMQSGSPR